MTRIHRKRVTVLGSLLAVVATAGVGCRGADGGAIAGAVAASAAAAVVESALESRGNEQGYVTASVPAENAAHPVDAEHAKAVLEDINLRACWPEGGTRGSCLVRVTFHHNGTVLRVGVAPSKNGTSLNSACVAERLREVIIDPFLGDTADISVTYDP